MLTTTTTMLLQLVPEASFSLGFNYSFVRATSKTGTSSQISIMKLSSDTHFHANTFRLSTMGKGCQVEGCD